MNLQSWLATKCNAHDVKPCKVTIEGETWEGCYYKQTLEYQRGMDAVTRGQKKAGDKYTTEAIYCIGELPKVKTRGKGKRQYTVDHVCFPYQQRDWYVAGYMLKANFTPTNMEYHPFGVHFMLAPWDIPNEPIDKYEPKPYNRFPMIVTYENTTI